MDKDEQKSHTLSGAAVREVSVTDSTLNVDTAASNSQSAIVDESFYSRDVRVEYRRASANKMGEGTSFKVVKVDGDLTSEKQREEIVTKVTFARNEMAVKNTGSDSTQVGIRTAATGDMLVECTDNKQTMENENAHGCLQAGVMRDGGAGAKGSTAVQSSGNEMVMKNSNSSGCIQAGVIGSGSAKSSEGNQDKRPKRRGDTMAMHNDGNARGNLQVLKVGKTVKK